MEEMNKSITGLSASKIASNLLHGKIQSLGESLWRDFTRNPSLFQRNVSERVRAVDGDGGDGAEGEGEGRKGAERVGGEGDRWMELFSALTKISWNDQNTYHAIKSSNLSIDFFRITFLYFSCSERVRQKDKDRERQMTCDPQTIEQIAKMSVKILEETRLEKNFETIISDTPFVLLLVKNSSEGSLPIISHHAQRFLSLLQHYSTTYTNRKKLFTFGTSILLKPFLDFYAFSRPSKSKYESVCRGIDGVVQRILFDDIHHIEELIQVSLTSLSNYGNDILLQSNSLEKKRKISDGAGGAGDDKRLKTKTEKKQSSSPAHAYHMSFYTTISDWVVELLQSPDLITGRAFDYYTFAVERLLQLYIVASKNMTKMEGHDENNSFVQKWRSHIKRVMHICIGMIYVICGDGEKSSNPTLSPIKMNNLEDYNKIVQLVQFRNIITKCLGDGVTGDQIAAGSGATIRSGAIPDHESLASYTQKLRIMGEFSLQRAVSFSDSFVDVVPMLGPTTVSSLSTLTADINFLKILIDIDCRNITDVSLPPMLHVVGSTFLTFKYQSQLLHGDLSSDIQALLEGTFILFSNLIALHGDLRRMDILLRALIEEINSNENDRGFAIALNEKNIQQTLHTLFGGMPDSQRNTCWEAFVHIALPEDSLVDCEGKLIQEKESSQFQPIKCLFSLGSILGAISLSVQPYRPIPESVVIILMEKIIRTLNFFIQEFRNSSDLSSKILPLEHICCALTSASILMRATFNFLSSSAFATLIPRYPYHIQSLNHYLSKESALENQHPQSEDTWIMSCILAAQFVTDMPHELISLSKDRLDGPFISVIIRLLEELCQSSIPDGFQQILGDILNCIIDLLFSCHSLFSTVTVPFSPLLQRCIEIDSSELDGASMHQKFADILQYPNKILQNQLIPCFLSFLTSPRRIPGHVTTNFLHYVPSLCQSIFENVSIWGSDYYSPNNEENDDLKRVLESLSLDLASILFAGESLESCELSTLQTELVSILNQPKFESYPFIQFAVAQQFCQQLQQSLTKNDYQQISRILQVSLHLQSRFFLVRWKQIVPICFEAINRFSSVILNDSTKCETSSILSAERSLLFIDHILRDVLKFEGDQIQSDFLQNILSSLPDALNQRLLDFMILIDTVSSFQTLQKPLDDILYLVTQDVFGRAFHLPRVENQNLELCRKLSYLFCQEDQTLDVDERSILTNIIVSLSLKATHSLSNSQQTENKDFLVIHRILSQLLHSFNQLAMRSALISPQNKGKIIEDIQNFTTDPVEELLGQLVDFQIRCLGDREKGNCYQVHTFYLIADLYQFLVCQRNAIDMKGPRRELGEVHPHLQSQMSNLVFSCNIPTEGWLYFLSIYLQANGKSFSEFGGRYLSIDTIGRLVECISTSLNFSDRSGDKYTIYLKQALRSLFSVTPPQYRERLVATPILKILAQQFTLPEHYHLNVSVITSISSVGSAEWRDINLNTQYRNDFRKNIVQFTCQYVEIVTTMQPFQKGPSESSGSLFLDIISKTSKLLRNQLQSAIKSLNPHKKTVSKIRDVESTGRQFEGSLATWLFDSIISFLSLSTSRLFSLLPKEYNADFVETILSLIQLCSDVLSTSVFPNINSNAGSLAILIRQLLLISIILVTSSPSITEAKFKPMDALRLIGRILMAIASSKHLQKHSHIFIACVIEALSGYSALQSQVQVRGNRQTSDSTDKSKTSFSITISSSDETLREHLYPGVFALLDRCRTSRQRKQIFAILDERSRLIFSDLNLVYQQDFKFIGKA